MNLYSELEYYHGEVIDYRPLMAGEKSRDGDECMVDGDWWRLTDRVIGLDILKDGTHRRPTRVKIRLGDDETFVTITIEN